MVRSLFQLKYKCCRAGVIGIFVLFFFGARICVVFSLPALIKATHLSMLSLCLMLSLFVGCKQEATAAELDGQPTLKRVEAPNSMTHGKLEKQRINTQKSNDRIDNEYLGQFNYGQTKTKNKNWVQSIKVLEPAYRSVIQGTITVKFEAPGMDAVEVRCWHQPDENNNNPFGYDAIVMPALKLPDDKMMSFEFPADDFPHGPNTIRIIAVNQSGKRDILELQLYNKGGVKWNVGVPEEVPPAAEGMRLVFEDDFDSMPSISPKGLNATYAAHKPRFGDFSGWRFSHPDDYEGSHDPFEQHGSWLRIKARKWGEGKRNAGTGMLSSARFDGSGLWAQAPCYFEIRFVAQSAPGTWPAFWTLTAMDKRVAGDELDIIEGYGGVGPGNPNSTDYHIVSHFWHQKDERGNKLKGARRRVPMMELGGKSFWSTTFHTYAVKITKAETIYYFDNIEVLRHPSGPISASKPAFFLINYAIGGLSGWKIDLARYGNGADMWVDYVRVFQGGDVDLSNFKLPKPAKK